MNLLGEYGLHYYYQVKPWCQVGVKATFESANLTKYTDSTRTITCSSDYYALISVMPSVRFTYLNRPWVRLYSGAEVGCSYFLDKERYVLTKEEEAEKSNNFLFAFNATIFGVNVGKKFFGMLEFNFGYDSYVKAGIGARF